MVAYRLVVVLAGVPTWLLHPTVTKMIVVPKTIENERIFSQVMHRIL